MIEKGVDPKSFRLNRLRDSSGALRASLLLIGAGVGLLMGYFLDRAFYMEEVAYFSMLFIFGGLGLGASYLIEEKKMKDEKTTAPTVRNERFINSTVSPKRLSPRVSVGTANPLQ